MVTIATVQQDGQMGKFERFTYKGYGALENRLSEVATGLGWDKASLAREAKLSYEVIARIWDKDARGVFFETLHRIAATLNVSLDQLFPIVSEEHNGD